MLCKKKAALNIKTQTDKSTGMEKSGGGVKTPWQHKSQKVRVVILVSDRANIRARKSIRDTTEYQGGEHSKET